MIELSSFNPPQCWRRKLLQTIYIYTRRTGSGERVACEVSRAHPKPCRNRQGICPEYTTPCKYVLFCTLFQIVCKSKRLDLTQQTQPQTHKRERASCEPICTWSKHGSAHCAFRTDPAYGFECHVLYLGCVSDWCREGQSNSNCFVVLLSL